MMTKLWPALLLAGSAGGAQAQATRMMMPEGTYDMVAGVALQNTFNGERGGGSRRVVVPALEVQWSNGVFVDVNVREAVLGVHLSDNPGLSYGVLALVSERDQRRDTPGRRGGVAMQAGAFVHWRVEHNIGLDAHLVAGGGFDRGGVLGHVGARIFTPLAAHHGATLGGGVFVADHRWQQGYFGVSPEQAASGGNPAYCARAGVFEYYGDLEWQWQWANKYWLSTGVRLSRLGSSPGASPLAGARERVSLRTAVTYHF